MPRILKGILCMLFTCCFCASAKADDLDPISSAYLSNKKYAKNMEVKAYLVTKDQVAKLFSEESSEITQKSNKELFGQEIYLLIRCKNIGDYRAFGTISCKTLKQGSSRSIEVAMMPGHMNFFYNSVFPIYSGSIPNNDEIPLIYCEWKNLYTI